MSPNKEQRERLKERLEGIDDFFDPAVDFVELDDNRLAFWEAYFWGRVACHFHMRVGKWGQRGTCNLCADFKVFRGMHEIEFDAFKGTFFKLKEAGGYKYGGYYPVFISVGEDSKDGQRIPLRLASSVRLKPLDDCPMRGEYVFESIGLCKLFRDDVLVGGLDKYRKSGSPRSAARKLLSSGFEKCELPHNVVENTPQVMNYVSYQQTQSESRQLWGGDDLKDVISRMRVELTAESYEVRFVQEEAGTDFVLKDVAMFPRPCEFGSDARKAGSVGHDLMRGPKWAAQRRT